MNPETRMAAGDNVAERLKQAEAELARTANSAFN